MYHNLKVWSAIFVLVVFAAVSAPADVVKPFMAGQHTQVGEVTVSTDGDGNVVIAIELDPGNDWCLHLTHVYVGEDPPGKIAPGQFPYREPVTDCKSQTYVIDPGDAEEVYVAVHADVGTEGDCETGCPTLPENIISVHVLIGTETFGVLDFSGAGDLNGQHGAWCLDADKTVLNNSTFDARLICSLDEEAEGCVDKPENLDAMNCLLNFLNDGLAASMPTIQTAFWILLDNSGYVLPGADVGAANLIAAMALACADGGGEPEPGDVVGVIVKPEDPALQPFVIPLPVPACGEETAWATEDGDIPFTNKNGQVTGWGTYFLYDVDGGVQVFNAAAATSSKVKGGGNQVEPKEK
jgi:hypothetical protein